MKLNRFCNVVLILVLLGLWAGTALAQESPSGDSAWITDKFEVTMRNGKGNRQTIVRMLSSGTRIEVLEVDKDEGYSRVRTSSGAEGWVLSRYLLSSPPARVTMPGVRKQLADSEEQRRTLARQLRELGDENAALKRQLGQTRDSGEDLERELQRIKTLSASTVQIDTENRELKASLTKNRQALERAQVEIDRLASRSNRDWFVIGAIVVIIGIVLGLILPRIRWRRKSGWGDL